MNAMPRPFSADWTPADALAREKLKQKLQKQDESLNKIMLKIRECLQLDEQYKSFNLASVECHKALDLCDKLRSMIAKFKRSPAWSDYPDVQKFYKTKRYFDWKKRQANFFKRKND